VAYEHGTLRSIPFQALTMARLTALGYRVADTVLITNADATAAAQRLGVKRTRFVPHPVNEDHLEDVDWKDLRATLLASQDADFIIFHPSRQHWSAERDPSLEKGNDIFLRGFARFVRDVDPRAMIVLVGWGVTLADTRRLLAQERIDDRVVWLPPQPHRALVRYIYASDAVADQFYLGTFGSLTPKVMACGRIPLVALDEKVHHWCFPELPPILNVRTEEEAFQVLQRLYREPAWRAEREAACRAWYRRYHSMSEVLCRLGETYDDVLRAGAASTVREDLPRD
jgi:glycosyltransferase involved in cell wall biosynthesis